MKKALDLILWALFRGRVVLLHCKGGRHRAGVVAGTTLAIVYDLTWSRGMAIVIDKRSSMYSEADRRIVKEIAQHLELHEFVIDYCRTDEWAEVASFFRDTDAAEA